MTILFCIVLGLAAGVLGGLFGIGGGIIIVPALVLALGYTQQKAQGTSLVALLAPVGLLAVINYYRSGNADLVNGLWIAMSFFIGAYIGSRIAIGMDEIYLRKVFAIFLACVAVYLFFRK